jgi:hypothetical protein
MHNQGSQQFHQYPVHHQNSNNFPQNPPSQPQIPPNQPQNLSNQTLNPQTQQQINNFTQNQQLFPNIMFNPNMFMMSQMTPEQQQQFQLEMLKKEAFHKGQILKKQKDAMEMIHRIRQKREEERKKGELVLFFNHNYDILPITITADKLIPELLNEYINQSGKQNVKFFFKNVELKITDQSGRQLYEIEGLRTGEEIIVKDSNEA